MNREAYNRFNLPYPAAASICLMVVLLAMAGLVRPIGAAPLQITQPAGHTVRQITQNDLPQSLSAHESAVDVADGAKDEVQSETESDSVDSEAVSDSQESDSSEAEDSEDSSSSDEETETASDEAGSAEDVATEEESQADKSEDEAAEKEAPVEDSADADKESASDDSSEDESPASEDTTEDVPPDEGDTGEETTEGATEEEPAEDVASEEVTSEEDAAGEEPTEDLSAKEEAPEEEPVDTKPADEEPVDEDRAVDERTDPPAEDDSREAEEAERTEEPETEPTVPVEEEPVIEIEPEDSKTASLPGPIVDDTELTPEKSAMQKRVIGATATLMEKQSELLFEARIDTGAKSCSLHVEKLVIEDEAEKMVDNIGKVIRFMVKNKNGETHWIESKIDGYVIVKSSSDTNKDQRYKVPVTLRWKDVEKTVSVTLNDRSHMDYPLLIGRNFLLGQFVVDVELDNND